MNSELSYIRAQCRRQEYLRAAKHEHRFQAAPSTSRSDDGPTAVDLRVTIPRRALAFRRAAVGAR